jgi:hypothetical protein
LDSGKDILSRTSLSIGRPWLSLDHTFKSVSNIGLVRLADKKWIKQYSGLFCILNADGEVLSWKLTKKLSFEHMNLLWSMRGLSNKEKWFLNFT